MKLACTLAAALAVVAVAPAASAIDLLTTTGAGPVNNCQTALPAYEGLIRKRPLAIINESTTPAFVTCALATEEISLNVQSFSTEVSNRGNEDATVSCTAVIGDELSEPVYVTKSVTLEPETEGQLTWNSGDAPGLLLTRSVALSCQLEPMTGLNRNRITTLLSII